MHDARCSMLGVEIEVRTWTIRLFETAQPTSTQVHWRQNSGGRYYSVLTLQAGTSGMPARRQEQRTALTRGTDMLTWKSSTTFLYMLTCQNWCLARPISTTPSIRLKSQEPRLRAKTQQSQHNAVHADKWPHVKPDS